MRRIKNKKTGKKMAKERNNSEEYPDYKTSYAAENAEGGFPIKKLLVIAGAVVVIIIIAILAINLLGQTNNALFYDVFGNILGSKVSISKDGKLIDSFNTDGDVLHLSGNPNGDIDVAVRPGSILFSNKNISVNLKSGGKIVVKTSQSGAVYVDENGIVHVIINPLEDLNIPGHYDDETGEFIIDDPNVEIIIEYVIDDPDSGETVIVELEADLSLLESQQDGCLSLSKTMVRDVTHYGTLETPTTIKLLCEPQGEIVALLEWKSERMGNVEVVFGNYSSSTLLEKYEKPILMPKDYSYNAKIIYTPFKEFAGQKAQFNVNIRYEASKGSIQFDVANDNLEQCIGITPEKLLIPKGQDETSITIDASTCHSEKIEVYLCDGDSGCTGGAPEGQIGVEQQMFVLSPKSNPKKTITLSRVDLPGAYGITIHARTPKADKILIGEETLIVEPNGTEELTPDKFVISLMGGAKDSMRITNTSLAEDIDVDASICSVYKNSLGTIAESEAGSNYGMGFHNVSVYSQSWWKDLRTSSSKFSGDGKYQAAFTNTLVEIDYLRYIAQAYSAEKNYKIKKSYMDLKGMPVKAQILVDEAAVGVTKAQDLKDKMDAANEFAEANFASQIVSTISSITGLATTYAILQIDLTTLQGYIETINACPPAVAPLKVATQALARANSSTAVNVATVAEGISAVNSIYSIYQNVDSVTKETDEINATGALEEAKNVQSKIKDAKSKIDSANKNVSLALGEASIDEFKKSSEQDYKAEEYLRKAREDMLDANALLKEALTSQLKANDFITTVLPELPSTSDTVVQGVQLLVQLVTMLGIVHTQSALIQEAITETSAAMKATTSAVASGCSAVATSEACCPVIGTDTMAEIEVSKLQANSALSVASALSVLNAVQTVYSAFSTYNTMTNDYTEQFNKVNEQFSTNVQDIYDMQDEVKQSLKSLPEGIDAAEWLGDKETQASKAAGYSSIVDLPESYNKERLTGLIGTALINGFVNGAYIGGVYNTKDTTFTTSASALNTAAKEKDANTKKISFEENNFGLKENCDNMVRITVPDYKTNLMQDAKPITISLDTVNAVWSFDEAKVFDVFESQEVGVIFANAGLRKNSFGTVEFKATKHENANPSTVTSGTFGPFNVPDISQNEISQKYHIKFNVEPRKGNTFVPLQNNLCTNELLRGKSGSAALPNILFSWDWNSVAGLGALKNPIKQNTFRTARIGTGEGEPFIDAVQLSILMSKKLGALNSFLSQNTLECPTNPSRLILGAIKPVIVDKDGQFADKELEDIEFDCFMPLTTKTYDGKPALYYYLTSSPLNEAPEGISDAEVVSTADEFLGLVDFNANLMRDGYGFDMQYDYADSYSRKILVAAPSFLDSSTGAKKFFLDKDRLFYTSEANFFLAQRAWNLPDAGKYRVRMLIDFDGYPAIFRGSSPAAKIKVELYSLEPVSSNFSPFYYVPIDGAVGAEVNNNRYGYGTSLTGPNPEPIMVSNTDSIALVSRQKDSLVKILETKLSRFGIENYSPSLRGKVITLQYNYNTKTLDDGNSYFLYSPVVGTPVIVKANGTAGESTAYVYSLLFNGREFDPGTQNLLLWTGVNSCTNLAGQPITKNYNRTGDSVLGGAYSINLPKSEVGGSTLLKTVVYSPIDDMYAISKQENGAMYTTGEPNGAANPVALAGITGMYGNDKANASVPNYLERMFASVEKGDLCISRTSSRESMWWSEESLFKKSLAGKESLYQREEALKSQCAR